MAERGILVDNLSRVTGRSKAQVRNDIKGVPTKEFTGEWRFFKDGKQVRGPTSKRARAILSRLGTIGGKRLLRKY